MPEQGPRKEASVPHVWIHAIKSTASQPSLTGSLRCSDCINEKKSAKFCERQGHLNGAAGPSIQATPGCTGEPDSTDDSTRNPNSAASSCLVNNHSEAQGGARNGLRKFPKANLFPKPGGECARVSAEEASRHKTSKQQGQACADAASIILQTARCMKVTVDSAELSSWAKIVHWLRGPNTEANVEMFGDLTVPHFTREVFGQAWTEHDVQCCHEGVPKDEAPNKRYGSDNLWKDLEMLVLADGLRKTVVDTDVLWQLQSLHETAAWAAEHHVDITDLHQVHQVQMLGMTAVEKERFVVEHSTHSRPDNGIQ